MAIMFKNDSLRIERLELGPWGTNAYIVTCMESRDSLLVDAPGGADTIMSRLSGTNLKYIALTHNHFDHTGALVELRSRMKAPLAAHSADSPALPIQPDIVLKDGDVLKTGKINIEVLHTPGHTPGSLCFKTGKHLISGDTIFPGGPGKTGSPGALEQIIRSIREKIMVLPDDTMIYPGHGEGTTLEKEKKAFLLFSSRPHDPGLCGDVLWLSSQA